MADNLVSKGADNLAPRSRDFYENSAFKLFLSITYGAFAIMFLGFSASAAGQSRSAYYLNDGAVSSDVEDGYYSQVTGYGFASFFYICAFVVMVGAAFHISPFVGGSGKEGRTLRSPLDLERSN